MRKLDADWLTGGGNHAPDPDEHDEELDQAVPEFEDSEEDPEEEEAEESEETQELTEEEESSEEDEEEEEVDEAIPSIINSLAEEGILEFDPEHEYSPGEEGFQEVVEYTIEKRLAERWNQVPEEFRSLKAHLEAGLPLSEWVQQMDPTDYAEADLEDEQTQEILVRDMYKAQGLSEQTIERKVAKLKEKADLEEEAQDAQAFLVEKQKADRLAYDKQLEEDRKLVEKKNQEFLSTRKTEILQAETFDGIPATKQQKEELFHYLYTPGKDGLTEFQKLLKDPKKLAELAYKAKTGVAGEYVQRKAATKATGTLKKELLKYSDTRSKSTGKQVQTNIETQKIPTQGMPWSK